MAAATAAGCGPKEPAEAPPPAPTAQPDDDGAPAAEYGAPMPPPDDDVTAPEYGAPAPPPDEGTMKPMYGVPPEQ